MRHGSLRRVHRSHQRHSHPQLRDDSAKRRRQRRHHHRRPQQNAHASPPEGLERRQRPPVWILPERPDHAGRSAPQAETQTHGPGYRRTYGRQYLPLWHLPAHSRRHQSSSRSKSMSNVTVVNRRGFLGTIFSAGALVLAAPLLKEDSLFAAEITPAKGVWYPSVYLGVQPDGTVIIVAHRSEMGTGIRTALPMVAADELDVEWSKVRVEQGLGDKKYGDQNTDGSNSIRSFYDPLRIAGATARAMLIGAAAAKWNVSAADCKAVNG